MERIMLNRKKKETKDIDPLLMQPAHVYKAPLPYFLFLTKTVQSDVGVLFIKLVVHKFARELMASGKCEN
jgi:hypothetical protein